MLPANAAASSARHALSKGVSHSVAVTRSLWGRDEAFSPGDARRTGRAAPPECGGKSATARAATTSRPASRWSRADWYGGRSGRARP